MKYGVYLPNFGVLGDARLMGELAHEAEDAGWDGFFIWDHIALWDGWSGPVVDPWVALTVIALRTTRIRFGALVTPLPRRRPWKFARETASLDQLSGGRLVVGVGIGNGPNEWERLGEEADLRRRGAMLDEALAVVTGLWSGEPFSLNGQYYTVREQQFLPPPLQQPRIPIWVAGFWPNKAPLRRAVQWDGVFGLVDMEGEPEHAAFGELTAYVRDLRREHSGAFDIVYAGHPTPGDDRVKGAEIVARYAELGVTWWLEHINGMVLGDTLEALRRRIRQGPPRV